MKGNTDSYSGFLGTYLHAGKRFSDATSKVLVWLIYFENQLGTDFEILKYFRQVYFLQESRWTAAHLMHFENESHSLENLIFHCAAGLLSID